MLTRLMVATLCVLCLTAAEAADVPLPGQRLLLKEPPGRLILVVRGDVPTPMPYAPDSPIVSGATLELTSGNGETASMALPASGWTANADGTTYRYRNPAAPGGPSPVRLALLRAGKRLKVVAGAAGL